APNHCAAPLPLSLHLHSMSRFFFFTDPAPPEIYTLSLHDALPISRRAGGRARSAADRGAALGRADRRRVGPPRRQPAVRGPGGQIGRHTSELQSLTNLVCRLLLEKKKTDHHTHSRRRP